MVYSAIHQQRLPSLRLVGVGCSSSSRQPHPCPLSSARYTSTFAPSGCSARSTKSAHAVVPSPASGRLRNRVIAAAAGAEPPHQQNPTDGSASRKKPAAVIGVDFGTSASGYAAALLPPQQEKQGSATVAASRGQLLQQGLVTCGQWPDDPTSSGDVKTKTALLYKGSKVVSRVVGLTAAAAGDGGKRVPLLSCCNAMLASRHTQCGHVHLIVRAGPARLHVRTPPGRLGLERVAALVGHVRGGAACRRVLLSGGLQAAAARRRQ